MGRNREEVGEEEEGEMRQGDGRKNEDEQRTRSNKLEIKKDPRREESEETRKSKSQK